MTTRTQSPAHWIFLVGATLVITASCSPADLAEPSVGDAASATDVAPAASRLGANVSKSLASLRSATAAFHDVNAAIAAGYANPSGIPCVSSAEGTMGVHVVKASLMDQAVRPNEPELLLYLPKADGGFKLLGVEYLVPVLVRDLSTGGVSPWFSMTPWGAGYEVVTPRPSVFGEAFEGPMPGHEPGMPWHYDKHVWLWNTNSSGMFSQWNPSIACP